MCRYGDGICDTPEMCDGKSQYCPEDVRLPDDTPCNNMGPAFCWRGECRSHSLFCSRLWRGAISANDDCYDLNKNGEQTKHTLAW